MKLLPVARALTLPRCLVALQDPLEAQVAAELGQKVEVLNGKQLMDGVSFHFFIFLSERR